MAKKKPATRSPTTGKFVVLGNKAKVSVKGGSSKVRHGRTVYGKSGMTSARTYTNAALVEVSTFYAANAARASDVLRKAGIITKDEKLNPLFK